MKLRRLIPLRFWLATILLMAAGMLAPGAASAHPGHGEERAQPRLMAFQAPPSTVSLDIHKDLANALLPGDDTQAARPAILTAQPDGERGCAGAACCGTSHACCVAYLSGWDEPPSPLAGNPLGIVLAGAPPGIGAPTLPEPPRPFR